ncbi:ABC transporter substrate-binding protein, partial [Frankia sp. Cr1]|uniref:ABC transporter substrate-binding protein n=1 Tax=Frankia sp. Cr1 TaxID=3073931 RepID=UPI002AD31E2F
LSAAEQQLGVTVRVTLGAPTLRSPNRPGTPNADMKNTFLFSDLLPFDLNSPGQQAYLAAMARYAPHIQPADQNTAVQGWILADLLINGLRASGPCPTRTGFMIGLRSLADYTAKGLLASRIDLYRNAGGETNRCLVFLQVTPAGFVAQQPVPRCGSQLPAG